MQNNTHNDSSLILMNCHRCKTSKEANHLFHCNTQADRSKKRRRCRKKYCDACLKRCYDIDAATVNRATWICPACIRLCPCPACQRTASQKDGLSQPPIRAFVLNQPVNVPVPSFYHPIVNDPCPSFLSPPESMVISSWNDNFIPASFSCVREENSSKQKSIISAPPTTNTSSPSGPPAVDSSLLALLVLLLLFKEAGEGSRNNPNINNNNGFTLPPPLPTATTTTTTMTTTATTTTTTMNSTLNPFHLNHPLTTPCNVPSNSPSPSPFNYNHCPTPTLFAPTTAPLLSSNLPLNDLLLLAHSPPSISELSSYTPAALAAYQQQLSTLQEHIALLQRHVAGALASPSLTTTNNVLHLIPPSINSKDNHNNMNSSTVGSLMGDIGKTMH